MGKASFVLALMLIPLLVPTAAAAPVCRGGDPVFAPGFMQVCVDAEGTSATYSNRVGVLPAGVVIWSNDLSADVTGTEFNVTYKTTNAGNTQHYVRNEGVLTCGVIIVPVVVVDNRACLDSSDPPTVDPADIPPFVIGTVEAVLGIVNDVCPNFPRCTIIL